VFFSAGVYAGGAFLGVPTDVFACLARCVFYAPVSSLGGRQWCVANGASQIAMAVFYLFIYIVEFKK